MTDSSLRNTFIMTSLFSLIIGLNACKDENPNPADKPLDETELITTAILLMTDSASGVKDTFAFRDPDGEGGNAPLQFDSIALNPNSTYECVIYLLDESKSPADSISNEVLEEAEDHLFVYDAGIGGLQIRIEDKDVNGLALGIKSKWKTTGPGNGSVRIRLKHQPGIKSGSAEPGETDLDLTFPCKIRP